MARHEDASTHVRPGADVEADTTAFDPCGWVPWVVAPRAAGRGASAPGFQKAPRRGPFAGVEPRGYARGDERILEDVCDRLAQHDHLAVRDVAVEVKDGEVTFEGTVPDRWTQRACEDEVHGTPRVRGVHNRLRIQVDCVRTVSGGMPGWASRPEER